MACSKPVLAAARRWAPALPTPRPESGLPQRTPLRLRDCTKVKSQPPNPPEQKANSQPGFFLLAQKHAGVFFAFLLFLFSPRRRGLSASPSAPAEPARQTERPNSF